MMNHPGHEPWDTTRPSSLAFLGSSNTRTVVNDDGQIAPDYDDPSLRKLERLAAATPKQDGHDHEQGSAREEYSREKR